MCEWIERDRVTHNWQTWNTASKMEDCKREGVMEQAREKSKTMFREINIEITVGKVASLTAYSGKQFLQSFSFAHDILRQRIPWRKEKDHLSFALNSIIYEMLNSY